MDTLRKSVGAKIKALRNSADMSQAELAHLIDCDTTLVGRYERGVHLPGVEQLIKIAEVFDVGPGELLPSGQDVRRTRLIALREKITQEISEVKSPDILEEILEVLLRLTEAQNAPKK